MFIFTPFPVDGRLCRSHEINYILQPYFPMIVTGHVASLEIVTDRRSRRKALVEFRKFHRKTPFRVSFLVKVKKRLIKKDSGTGVFQ